MTEEQREKAFPIHIELGREMSNVDMFSPSKTKAKGKKKMVYPSLFISDIEGLEEIPDEGCMLVHFKRRGMSINKDDKNKTTASVELQIKTICLQDEEDEDTDDMIDKMFKKSQKHVGYRDEDEETEDEE